VKSPQQLAIRLAKQWHNASLRVERLLTSDAWPMEVSIGKPTSAEFASNTAGVQAHVDGWRKVNSGELVWQEFKYRAGAEAVSLPIYWRFNSPSQWVSATGDAQVKMEYKTLEFLVSQVSDIYREVLIRERGLWQNKTQEEVVTTAKLANSLSPGVAKGRPLRLLAGYNVDTKFFERNSILLTRLLDQRYQNAASEQGLKAFLDAYDDNDHWVMVAPLDEGLLRFSRLRITTKDLAKTGLPCSRILVVENEQCFHMLPKMPATIAILGAGLDLQWLSSAVFNHQSIAYWGDMDTWGLLMLARAKQYRPSLMPVLMEQALFKRYAEGRAVVEPTVAQQDVPKGLSPDEAIFYEYLLSLSLGRLEQEFLPEALVCEVLLAW